MGFKEFKKSFDTVEIWTLEQALKNSRTENRFTNFIKQAISFMESQTRLIFVEE